MADPKKLKTLLMSMGASLLLAACSGGGSEVASPGEGVFQGGSGGGGSGGGGSGGGSGGTVPSDCPTGFTNAGTIANNTLRNCELPSLITGTLVAPLRQNTVYSINGRVNVGEDQGGDAANPIGGAQSGTLTIEPGVTLFGSAGLDYILVNRGSRILADGTVSQPIIFTSRSDLEGTAGADTIGQWGGVIVLGRAPISNCNAGGATPGAANCERVIEGATGLYGGNATEDNSGRVTFVQIRFTGYAISAGNELQGLTLGGVGRGTTVHHVQVHNSADDGIEIFGGNVNLRHIVLTGNDDDSLDTDNGYNGKIQFVVAIQRQTAPLDSGSRLVESSSAGTTPRSNPKISNFTFIGRNRSGDDGLVANSNTSTGFYNGIVVLPNGAPNGGVNIGGAGDGTVFHSVVLDNDVAFAGGAAANGDTAATRFAAGTNNNSNFTNTLSNTIVNGANEAAVPVFNVTTLNGGGDTFFQSVNYIGAVRDSSDVWWQGWTCSLPGEETCH